MTVEEPFRLDIDYYEGRADGIATVNGVTVDEARRDLAAATASPPGRSSAIASRRCGAAVRR